MDDEKSIWQGSPSQLINGPVFLICALAVGLLWGVSGVLVYRHAAAAPVALALAGAAIIPFGLGLFKWLTVRSLRYELTTERLLMSSGIFSRNSEALELYRVKDYELQEPFVLRLFGLGNLVLLTHDESNPTVLLRAIPGSKALRDQIRQHVEECRDKKRVRVAELE
jgi:uncharacterized membrane protein YdbT with pleckstrin-like domain